MKNYKKAIFAVVLLLAIGFAAVTTTLVLNGTLLFGVNLDDFEIIFTSAVVDGTDVTDTAISPDGKTITFTTKDLKIKGDKSVLDFEVTNSSTQYDGNVEMTCTADGANAAEYYTITPNMPEVIVAQTSEQGTVTVELTKTSVTQIEETFSCTIFVSAVERTEAAFALDAAEIEFQSEYDGWEVSTAEEALNYLRDRYN